MTLDLKKLVSNILSIFWCQNVCIYWLLLGVKVVQGRQKIQRKLSSIWHQLLDTPRHMFHPLPLPWALKLVLLVDRFEHGHHTQIKINGAEKGQYLFFIYHSIIFFVLGNFPCCTALTIFCRMADRMMRITCPSGMYYYNMLICICSLLLCLFGFGLFNLSLRCLSTTASELHNMGSNFLIMRIFRNCKADYLTIFLWNHVTVIWKPHIEIWHLE